MAKWSLLLLYFFQGLLPLIFGQQYHQHQQQHVRTSGPWRHRFQWQNNGQMFSLVSTGSEYQAPVRSSRSQSRLYVSSSSSSSSRRGSAPHSESRSFRSDHTVDTGSSGPGQRQYSVNSWSRVQQERPPQVLPGAPRPEFISTVNASAQGSRRGAVAPADPVLQNPRGAEVGLQPLRAAPELRAQPEVSIPVFPITPREPEAPVSFPAPAEEGHNEAEDMVNDDPRNPYKNHRNSVLYNMYPPRGRTGPRPRRPPGTGHGTRYFQNGLPDLVPDPYAIQAGAFIQRMQMYALRCAAEENCLARSAYGPAVRDIDFRVLLRFPQKVKNQGTTDFLPVKPRYQWDWHSCHQHYHSMDAFSNYDLLDVVTGRRVAEGHKASFCLEDTGCDPGFRRRYACTSHTQGLSPGCHDLYAANIDCQWIDITDVPPGNYILKVTVNPNFHVMESDFTNNVVRCDVMYTGVYIQTRNCRVTRG